MAESDSEYAQEQMRRILARLYEQAKNEHRRCGSGGQRNFRLTRCCLSAYHPGPCDLRYADGRR